MIEYHQEEIDELTTAKKELLSILLRLEPHIDAIICYASTCGEYEPNAIAQQAYETIAKYKG